MGREDPPTTGLVDEHHTCTVQLSVQLYTATLCCDALIADAWFAAEVTRRPVDPPALLHACLQ